MQPFDSISKIEKAKSLDGIANLVTGWVNSLVKPQPLRDALHGRWLGHPLHPALVQLPIGAWVSAATLDCLPGRERAARSLVGAGVLTAMPAAVAGATDFSVNLTDQKRVGVVHATANLVAASLYGLSWMLRSRDPGSGAGKALGFAGLSVVTVGGVLGGHLAYRQTSGPNRAMTAAEHAPTEWQAIGPIDQLPEGQFTQQLVGLVPVAVLRRGNTVHAIADECSHLSGPLSSGSLLTEKGEDCVQCPWHGSVYRLRDGMATRGPATATQPVFETRVRDGQVEVRI